ncbi:MAG: MBL fold metallo-hydrolase, partial [Candidatus Thermoplasmatota archaeon]|nr:MBL fold metallo-hydrolase [Candidatus Thermoplasmatota archaeon]
FAGLLEGSGNIFPAAAGFANATGGNLRLSASSVLIDAGISCREMERRLSAFGTEAQDIDAVLLTHEHTDHNRGAKRFCGIHDIPVFGTEGTLALTPLEGTDAKAIERHGTFAVGDLSIRAFPVMHLAAEPVGYSISLNGRRVSVASDLGSLTEEVLKGMRGSDLVMIEANYDETMLMNGCYPDFLKRTIAGGHGHLSNEDSGRLCSEIASERIRQIVLLHLSKDNNTMDLAKEAVERCIMGGGGTRPSISPTEHGCQNGPFAL